jgi:hypothetical protein
MITKKKIVINKKGLEAYESGYFTNVIAATNQNNSFPINQENRRFQIYDTNKTIRGNTEYFKSLVECMNNNKTKYAFYQFLKNYKTYDTPIEFQSNIPETPAYQEVRRMNAPVIEKWLASLETLDIIHNKFKIRELHSYFKNWCICENRTESAKMTLTSFTQHIKNSPDKEFDISTLNGYPTAKGDRNKIIPKLKTLYLLDSDFIYKTKEQRDKEEKEEKNKT